MADGKPEQLPDGRSPVKGADLRDQLAGLDAVNLLKMVKRFSEDASPWLSKQHDADPRGAGVNSAIALFMALDELCKRYAQFALAQEMAENLLTALVTPKPDPDHPAN